MSKGGEIKQGERNAHLFLKGSGIDISNSEKKLNCLQYNIWVPNYLEREGFIINNKGTNRAKYFFSL